VSFLSLTTSVRTLNRFGWRTSNQCWTIIMVSSTFSIGTFIWFIRLARDYLITFFYITNTVSIWAFNRFLLWAWTSCRTHLIIINAFTIPTMELSWVTSSYNTISLMLSAWQIWTSDGILWTRFDCWAHEIIRGAFSSWTLNLS